MIHDWRTKFASPKLPFYFVQLAPCYGHKDCGNFVNVRNAQMAGLLLPSVSYATAVDLGDRSSPYVSVHPRRKQELCRRLSLQALKLQYGMTTLVSSGPEFASVAVAAGSALTIKYKPGTAGTLHSAETADSPEGCAVSPFEMSITAGNWVRANFTIVGKTVTLKMPGGTTALASTGVRYAWATAPTCMLYNGEGAPGTGPNGTQPATTPGATGIAGTPFCWTGTASCPVV
jgi:sialate O-acetylesterase